MSEPEVVRTLSDVERAAYAEAHQAVGVAMLTQQLQMQALSRLERVLTGGDPGLAIDPRRGVVVRKAAPERGPDATA